MGLMSGTSMDGVRDYLTAHALSASEIGVIAFLAIRSLRGLPLTYYGTTGVAEPLTGGVLAAA